MTSHLFLTRMLILWLLEGCRFSSKFQQQTTLQLPAVFFGDQSINNMIYSLIFQFALLCASTISSHAFASRAGMNGAVVCPHRTTQNVQSTLFMSDDFIQETPSGMSTAASNSANLNFVEKRHFNKVFFYSLLPVHFSHF